MRCCKEVYISNKPYNQFQEFLSTLSTAWRNSQKAAVGGVGLQLDRRPKKALGEVKTFSNRILVATFEGNPTTTVIVAYSPTNTTGSEEKVELFYQELREATKATPKHNMLITLEDFNAHIDKDSAQHSFQEQSTRNGEYLLEFAEEQELTICNSNFRK